MVANAAGLTAAALNWDLPPRVVNLSNNVGRSASDGGIQDWVSMVSGQHHAAHGEPLPTESNASRIDRVLGPRERPQNGTDERTAMPNCRHVDQQVARPLELVQGELDVSHRNWLSGGRTSGRDDHLVSDDAQNAIGAPGERPQFLSN